MPRGKTFTRIEGVTYPYPICGLCSEEVEAFTWADILDRLNGDKYRVFFSHCHNATEVSRIAIVDLQTLKALPPTDVFIPPVSGSSAAALRVQGKILETRIEQAAGRIRFKVRLDPDPGAPGVPLTPRLK